MERASGREIDGHDVYSLTQETRRAASPGRARRNRGTLENQGQAHVLGPVEDVRMAPSPQERRDQPMRQRSPPRRRAAAEIGSVRNGDRQVLAGGRVEVTFGPLLKLLLLLPAAA